MYTSKSIPLFILTWMQSCVAPSITSNKLCYGPLLSIVMNKLLKQQILLYTRKSISVIISTWMLPCCTVLTNWTTLLYFFSSIWPIHDLKLWSTFEYSAWQVNEIIVTTSHPWKSIPVVIPTLMLSCGNVISICITLLYFFSSLLLITGDYTYL